MIDGVGSAQVKMCLDVPHLFTTRADLERSIEKTTGYVSSAHVSDTTSRSDEHLLPGEGIIPWGEVMKAFEASGFSGPFLFEVDISEVASLTAKQKIERLRKSKEFLDASAERQAGG